ncbi:inositol-3-phosphate synthase [Zhihengliuella flava]|uniref:Myo-inositol-1-phosphate synthase n=1 Tax=Zhihengliuella flava TaxID=1285193 RepID=A0A931GLM0_9MICC|nr:myo-inositol-1-phosphate synthase [Zhihengliuella flava]
MVTSAGRSTENAPGADASAEKPTRVGRVGLWLIGARGSVATTAATGLAAISGGFAPATGCVTDQRVFDAVPLPEFSELVIGGHDISDVSLAKRAEYLVGAGMLPLHLMEAVRGDLDEADARVRPGYHPESGGSSQAAVARRLARDIEDFTREHRLDRVVVMDVSSTEAPVAPRPEFDDPELLLAALEDPAQATLPPSSLGAYAAILAGAPYVCFTPSPALTIPALRELARQRGIPTAGQDGKTGQTWLRSVIAPGLAARGLRVLSWAGANLLGGGDGATLSDPDAVSGKLLSKNRGLESLASGAATPLHIDNVPDLGETKVAWDHINVEGFLGSRLTLQTTWSAFDSMLAAPMILDLARLMALADAAGASGPIGELGFFFKDPWGSDEFAFAEQSQQLAAWAHATGERVTAAGAQDRVATW